MSSLDLSSSFSGLEKGASFGGGWLDGGDERTVVSAAGSSKAKEAVRRKTTTVAAKTYDPDLLWCVCQRAPPVRSMLALTLESLAGCGRYVHGKAYDLQGFIQTHPGE